MGKSAKLIKISVINGKEEAVVVMRIFLVVVHPLNEEARTGRKVQQVNN